ncbi:hypothetical protein ACOSQ2_032922 [Xanthoceras sorbifolium]
MENNSAERPNEPAANNRSTTVVVNNNNNNHRHQALIVSQARRSLWQRYQTPSRRGRNMSNRARSIYLDNSHPAYSWLLLGWLVEESRMDHGRIYRYFMILPAINTSLRTRSSMHAWEESAGFVVLDP